VCLICNDASKEGVDSDCTVIGLNGSRASHGVETSRNSLAGCIPGVIVHNGMWRCIDDLHLHLP
jgi:hypothetical protein